MGPMSAAVLVFCLMFVGILAAFWVGSTAINHGDDAR